MPRLIDQREYIVWRGMRQRCRNPHCKSFADYGGRGIGIDPAWDSYARFLSDMGPRPSPAHTIERLDNNGHYAPGNCVWALREAQNKNKRGVLLVTHSGETLPIHAWATRLGIKYTTLHHRLVKYGWPVERALRA